MLSVIIPSYNEEQMIEKTATVISNILNTESIEFELIFVNDGSKDHTWDEISKQCRNNTSIKGINFSRNFGKESAMFAGLAYAKGDCCVLIDCDLQHPPKTIVEMYRLWEQGYEIVEGVKASRGKESIFHTFAAKTFYRLISVATGIDMSRASDFKLLDKRAVEALLKMPEKHVFFRALSSWIGFKTISVEFEVHEREVGESKWSTNALVKYAINNITSFSAAPMQIITFLGLIFLFFSVVMIIHTLVIYSTGGALEGFTTVIILLLLIGSLIMISLGIIGYYIAKIYDEVKGRPKYIVSKTENE